ncbi:hypothetical protein P43SY_008390 [Pythium insidiosum]|uniref:Synaptobrevin-like protein n=1 Tax=Pythium insidiosum TaxID=114742 RepID=A0AAD5LA61_PYTIN|nr:hypothetical protein P43SY_008390 [Pythium insidiosum]
MKVFAIGTIDISKQFLAPSLAHAASAVFPTELLRHEGKETAPTILSASFELSSFGYFQRANVREFINFFSKTLTQRSPPQQCLSIEREEYRCHVFIRHDGLAGIAVADHEYPPRVAFALVKKLIDEYDGATQGAWKSHAGAPQNWAPLQSALQEYQDPSKADKIMAIQKELDETTAILSKAIDSVLERDEKLTDLVAKSLELSTQSKVFYREAQRTNSCCILM